MTKQKIVFIKFLFSLAILFLLSNNIFASEIYEECTAETTSYGSCSNDWVYFYADANKTIFKSACKCGYGCNPDINDCNECDSTGGCVEGEICSNGQCVQCTSLDTSECPTEKPKCKTNDNPKENKCVECTADTHCDTGNGICDTTTNECKCNASGSYPCGTYPTCSAKKTWYKDEDEDGYYPDDGTKAQCDDPDGDSGNNHWTTTEKTSGDCNDSDANIHPNATEICDGKDNDCDGSIDERLTAPNNDKQKGVCADSKSSLCRSYILLVYC